MFEITGKYGTAKVYATTLEDECISQIYGFMNSPVVEGCNIAIMPDAHCGKGASIGFTQKINGRVNPNMVGFDISCGMLVAKLDGKKVNELFGHIEGLKRLDKVWHQKIPMGCNHRNKLHKFAANCHLDKIKCPVNRDKLLYSIGTLGGGNHFCELDKDDEGNYYIVIHSGSRHLGVEIAKYYEKKAKEYQTTCSKEKSDLIAKLKAEGREKEIQSELAKLSTIDPTPGHLPYLEGDLLEEYLNDMKYAQEFAMWNREAMLEDILDEFKLKKAVIEKFCTLHNYIDIENGILRKGAISLQKDELAIIPGSMEFGSLIVRGKGNPEWNFSGPHGFGRKLSRSKAKETLRD